MTVPYTKYSYLFPPRPEKTTHPDELSKYDNDRFIAQPKYNGTCCNVFISENEIVVMNRHAGKITSQYNHIKFKDMHKGKGWMVVSGEFLNKNQKGEDGKPFNLKFVLWDILVYQGEYLIGVTLEERLNLLEKLFPCSGMSVGKTTFENYQHLCCTKYENIYRAPSYYKNFEKLYKSIVNTDLYEGVVLKRRDAKLAFGFNSKNNNDWQIKCRKPTKNYAF